MDNITTIAGMPRDGYRSSARKDAPEYWAAMAPKEAASEICDRVAMYFKDLQANGRALLWQRTFNAYYGLDEQGSYHKSSAVAFGGQQGEVSLAKVNSFRSLMQHVLIMSTAERAAFTAHCAVYDAEAIAQQALAEDVTEYELRHKGIEKKVDLGFEASLIFDEGYIAAFWDPSAGEQYGYQMDEQGQPMIDEKIGQPMPLYSGAIDFRWYMPNAMPKDIYSEGGETSWYAPLDWVNRYDLVAKYPELSDYIMGLKTRDGYSYGSPLSTSNVGESDQVAVYSFMHKKTPALPNGRFMIMSDPDTIYFDGPLPTPEMYVYRMAPSEMLSTSHGYTNAYDLLSLTQMRDSIVSTVMTNIDAHGLQNIIAPDNCALEAQDLGGGKQWLKYNEGAGGKPELLNLLDIPDAMIKFYELLGTEEQNISGINSAARGTPEYSNMSGSALALLADKAVSFNRGAERTRFEAISWAGNTILKLYKQFASAPQVMKIVGPNNDFSVKEFTKDDINGVELVVIEMGNALEKTTAGRMQIAEGIAKNFPGSITPEQYIEVMKTGRLDPVSKYYMIQEALVQRENQGMYAGKTQEVNDLDRHSKHVREHACLLASPEVRGNPQLTQLIQEHIGEHRIKLQTVDPYLLKMIGEEPIPPPMAAPMPGQEQGAAPPGQGTPPKMGTNVSPNGTPGMPGAPQTVPH